jgi:hypothetical protein
MACVSMSQICTKFFISSFGVYKEMPTDVSAIEGALDLLDYVAGIVKDNWTMEVLIWNYSKVHMHHQNRSL